MSVKKVIHVLALTVMALLITVNLYMIVMRYAFGQRQPSVFGFSTAVVLSGSMEPVISVDDLIVVRHQEHYELRDIVMYEGQHSMVTHRIVGMEDGAYITRGDSNNADDPAVLQEKVVGKVICIIPGVGKVLGFLQTPLGMCLFLMAATAMLLLPDAGRKSGKE